MYTTLRSQVAGICSALPGAEICDPWGGGQDAWKVGGKAFALIGAAARGVAVKCPDDETAEMLRQSGIAIRALYLEDSWVLLPADTEAAELKNRLVESYNLICAELPAARRPGHAPRERE